MIDDGSVFASLIEDDARLAVDRAVTELRAGRPVAVGWRGRTAVIAAIDGIRPSLFDAFAAGAGRNPCLALTAPRAGALGLLANGPIAVAVAGIDRDAVCRLAAGRDAARPTA